MEATPISPESYKLGFIGAGKMAESIARGVVQSGVLLPQRISTAVHSNPNRRIAFESFGVGVRSNNSAVPLALSLSLPFVFVYSFVKDVVLQLKPMLSEKKLLVSVAAGVKLKVLQVCAYQSFTCYT
ncbi:hypothetical protein Pint_20113 [Pistacia integerrima]|uniref:Uncharacterized protein n=1 Tax=Pistacia integerrima TaxID=434235 RepID=A0ACC0XC70_9ROSI|nr:hypothetical protein Pint_20113 [Pistacia integerrima]